MKNTTVEIDTVEVNAMLSEVTPYNYLAAIDFLQDNNYILPDDLIDEVDYAAIDY